MIKLSSIYGWPEVWTNPPMEYKLNKTKQMVEAIRELPRQWKFAETRSRGAKGGWAQHLGPHFSLRGLLITKPKVVAKRLRHWKELSATSQGWRDKNQSPGLTVEDETWWTVREIGKSTRLNSSHGYISYAVFCLKKKKETWHCAYR